MEPKQIEFKKFFYSILYIMVSINIYIGNNINKISNIYNNNYQLSITNTNFYNYNNRNALYIDTNNQIW